MSTVLYSELIDEVQLYTESVPRATIEQFVRKACIMLCTQTRIWKDSGTETLVPGEDDVAIDGWINAEGSTERQLITIEELRYDGAPLARKTEKQIADLTDRYGTICGFYQPALHIIQLLNVPDAFEEKPDYISYNISVAPSRTSTGMDGDILNRYRDGVVAGAVGMLFSMPKKTWSNPQFGVQYVQEFGAAIRRATTDANQEFGRRIARTVKYGGI